MIANFRSMPGREQPQHELNEHAEYLGRDAEFCMTPSIGQQPPPEGYEDYVVVDLLGAPFVWLNETYTKDRYTWYIWYESVFLVPEEIASFLLLKWEQQENKFNTILMGGTINMYKYYNGSV